jgi:hypothetical protein
MKVRFKAKLIVQAEIDAAIGPMIQLAALTS